RKDDLSGAELGRSEKAGRTGSQHDASLSQARRGGAVVPECAEIVVAPGDGIEVQGERLIERAGELIPREILRNQSRAAIEIKHRDRRHRVIVPIEIVHLEFELDRVIAGWNISRGRPRTKI